MTAETDVPCDFDSLMSMLGSLDSFDSVTERKLIPGKKGFFRYIIVHVDDQDSTRVQSYAAPIVESILRHKGRLWYLDCPILFGTFGFPDSSDEEGIIQQQAALAEISTFIGRTARVIFGATEGTFELQGSSRMTTIVPITPFFGKKLTRLLTLKAGEVVET